MAECTSFDWLTQEEEEELKTIYAKDGEKAGVLYLNSRTEEWSTIPLKFGVFGAVSKERSIFINTLRELPATADETATLELRHIFTAAVIEYDHQNNPMLKFCDLLSNSFECPNLKDAYLIEINANSYDGFIITTSKRFTPKDLQFAEQIKKLGKHLYFVRLNVDYDIANDRQNHTKESILARIRKGPMDQLKELAIEKVFLVNEQSRILHEFKDLELAILNDLPALKRQAMILSLTAKTGILIKMKAQELRKRCVYKSLVVSALLCEPLQDWFGATSRETLTRELSFYYTQLGLDEESLKERATLKSVDVNSLLEIVSRTLPLGVEIDDTKQLADLAVCNGSPSVHIEASIKDYNTWIPKCIAFDPMKILVPMYTMHRMLDSMKETSLNVQRYKKQ